MRHRVLRPAVAALAVATCLALSAPALACMGNMATTDPGTQAGTATDTGVADGAIATDTTVAVTSDTTAAAPVSTAPVPTTVAAARPGIPQAFMHAFASVLSHLLASLTQALRAVTLARPLL